MGVLDVETRLEHFRYAVEHGAAPLRERSWSGRVSVVGYGPSLRDTWQDIRHPIIATSGAQEFLRSRGVVSDFYVGLDPRVHKLYWLRDPDPRTIYLMASLVSPFSWAMLEGCVVWRWHSIGLPVLRDWVLANDPDCCRIKVGSEVGVSALRLAYWMGFRQFDLYGMDHTKGHAAECPNPPQDEINFQGFRTTPQLLWGARELARLVSKCDATIHGPSLAKIVSPKQRVTLLQEGGLTIKAGPSTFDAEAFMAELAEAAVRPSLTITTPPDAQPLVL